MKLDVGEFPKTEPKTGMVGERPILSRSTDLSRYPAMSGIPDVRFFDTEDNEITQAEFEAWFTAPLDIRRANVIPGLQTVRLAAVLERDWGAVQLVTIIDADLKAVPGVAVGRWWSDAPPLDPFPPDCFATRWKDRAVVGWTNDEGNVGFGMGRGDTPPGSSGIFPIHCQAPADWCGGLGWAPGIEHKTAYLVYVLGDDEEPPPPEDDFETKTLQYLWGINRKLGVIVGLLEGKDS